MGERGQAGKPGPPVLGLVIIVLCLGGFAANLRVPLLDGLDAMFPTREAVSRQARGGTAWDVTLTEEGAESPEVLAALSVLSPAYRKVVRDFGGQLAITSRDALSRVRTPSHHELMYTAGVYFPDGRVAYIAHDSGDPGWTALHELGHMLDHALGEPSGREAFAEVFEQLRTDERLSAYARSNPKECFAELFTRYYFSDRRRRHLSERFPLAAHYMVKLERRVISEPHAASR